MPFITLGIIIEYKKTDVQSHNIVKNNKKSPKSSEKGKIKKVTTVIFSVDKFFVSVNDYKQLSSNTTVTHNEF